MKKILFVSLSVLSLYGCGQKRPAVIERPVFEVTNTTTIEIDKIEMSDSATVFHIDAFMRFGGWFAIDRKTYVRESGSDEKLMITHSEGINIGERTNMPESGTISFKLFFPSLRPEVTKIDYIEDYPDGGWKILGIHLLPNAKIKFDPIPKEAIRVVAKPLPVAEFIMQPSKVSGKMHGYVEGITSNEVTLYATNIINGERIEAKLPIAEDGSFSGEITPGMAGIAYSSAGYLFLVPGQETKIYTDLKKRSRYQSRHRTDKEPGDSIFTYVSGNFTSVELSAINQSTRNLFDFQKLMQETVKMNPDQYKQHLLDVMYQKINELRQKNYSEKTLMMMENYVKFRVCTMLMQYEAFINSAYMQVNNIKREDRDTVTFKAPKPDLEYYSFLKDLLDNDYMSYHPDFSSLIESISRIDYFNIPDGKDKPAKERFAYFREKFAPVLGTDKGILFDIMQARFYGRQLNDMKFYTDAEKREIRAAFSDKPAYAEALIAENDKMVALMNVNKENKESIANELPMVTQEKMFDAILAKYKGKMVLVDFWATWCGPCMVAMKSIEPLKEEMKGKDVTWLYLTGETSPLNAWTRTYPTISGEHYRVSEAQWSYWSKTFGIQGIPTYMVYDRQGKQISRYTGFPGVDVVKNDLEKGL